MPEPTDLSAAVALVAGASRGVGRGVALALGEDGAPVVVPGRPRKRPRRRAVGGSSAGPAGEGARLGGRGVAVQTDHTRVEDVRALVDGVRQREGRLDVLVHAVWGGHEVEAAGGPLWEQPLALWDATMRAGVWAALLTARYAAPLLIETADRAARTPLVATISPHARGAARLYDGLAGAALDHLAAGLAQDLKPHGVASVAVVPGTVRTERVLDAFGTSERRWARVPELAGSESPRYAGRAVAALAADPAVFTRTGERLLVGDLARAYGFTDTDGSRPAPVRRSEAPAGPGDGGCRPPKGEGLPPPRRRGGRGGRAVSPLSEPRRRRGGARPACTGGSSAPRPSRPAPRPSAGPRWPCRCSS